MLFYYLRTYFELLKPSFKTAAGEVFKANTLKEGLWACSPPYNCVFLGSHTILFLKSSLWQITNMVMSRTCFGPEMFVRKLNAELMPPNPGRSAVKNLPRHCRRRWLDPGSGRSLDMQNGNPPPHSISWVSEKIPWTEELTQSRVRWGRKSGTLSHISNSGNRSRTTCSLLPTALHDGRWEADCPKIRTSPGPWTAADGI